MKHKRYRHKLHIDTNDKDPIEGIMKILCKELMKIL